MSTIQKCLSQKVELLLSLPTLQLHDPQKLLRIINTSHSRLFYPKCLPVVMR